MAKLACFECFFFSGDPHNDPNAVGTDAFKTLFIGRIVCNIFCRFIVLGQVCFWSKTLFFIWKSRCWLMLEVILHKFVCWVVAGNVFVIITGFPLFIFL